MKKARGKAAAKHNMAKAANKAAANNVAVNTTEKVKASVMEEIPVEESKEQAAVFTEENKAEAAVSTEENKAEAAVSTEENKAEAAVFPEENKEEEIVSAEENKAEAATVPIEEFREAVKEVFAEESQEDEEMAMKPEVVIQYRHNEVDMDQVIEKVKEDFAVRGNRGVAIEKIQIYVKPEDFTAYYVINDDAAGKVSLF
ncbi:MAG: hypothetical protein K2M46_07500 [Lachnospiraceae bacterium]|nr:hypothetical protein [Lachnospiraceae bacterium]